MPIKNGPLVDGAWQIRGGHQTTINAFFGNYSAWGLRGLSCLNPSRNTCSKTETWPPTIFLGLDASITFRSVFRTKEEGTSAVTVRSWSSMLSTFTDLVINHPSSNSLLLEHRLIPLLRSPLAFRCRGFAEPRRFFRFREQHHYYYCYFRGAGPRE